MVFKKEILFPLAWYYASKYPYVVSSFTRWMENYEPLEHPDMTKHNNNLYVFTGLPCVKISFKEDRDSGKKTVELGPKNPEQTPMPYYDFQAICFKRMIETNLATMECILYD
jgi:hypothetical protein